MAKPAPLDLIEQAAALRKQGKTISETAQILNRPTGTIKSWLNRTKSFTVKGLASRVEKVVLKRLQSEDFVAKSRDARAMLAAEAIKQAKKLTGTRIKSYDDLVTTPAGQGRAAVLKQLGDACATVFGWGSDKSSGMILMESAREIEASVVEPAAPAVQDTTTGRPGTPSTPENAGPS